MILPTFLGVLNDRTNASTSVEKSSRIFSTD